MQLCWPNWMLSNRHVRLFSIPIFLFVLTFSTSRTGRQFGNRYCASCHNVQRDRSVVSGGLIFSSSCEQLQHQRDLPRGSMFSRRRDQRSCLHSAVGSQGRALLLVGMPSAFPHGQPIYVGKDHAGNCFLVFMGTFPIGSCLTENYNAFLV